MVFNFLFLSAITAPDNLMQFKLKLKTFLKLRDRKSSFADFHRYKGELRIYRDAPHNGGFLLLSNRMLIVVSHSLN
jgi:hypothetical protein